jgi:uncharacterized protein
MILIDSNIPMYLVGAPHPLKGAAEAAVRRLLHDGRALVTDAEVFQEVLHRYTHIGRPEAIGPAFDTLLALAQEVLPVERRDVLRARDIVLGVSRVSARDSVHIAVMEHHGVEEVLSFNRGFDGFPGIRRLPA